MTCVAEARRISVRFCEFRGEAQCPAATLGCEISVQIEEICGGSGNRGKEQLRPRKAREQIARAVRQGFAGRSDCPIYLGLWYFGDLGKAF